MTHTKHEAKNWHESKRSCKSESVSRREIERSIKKSSSKIKLLSWSLSSNSQVSTATWISFMKMCFLFSFGIEPEGIAKQYPLRMWVVRDKKIKFKMCEKYEFLWISWEILVAALCRSRGNLSTQEAIWELNYLCLNVPSCLFMHFMDGKWTFVIKSNCVLSTQSSNSKARLTFTRSLHIFCSTHWNWHFAISWRGRFRLFELSPGWLWKWKWLFRSACGCMSHERKFKGVLNKFSCFT